MTGRPPIVPIPPMIPISPNTPNKKKINQQ